MDIRQTQRNGSLPSSKPQHTTSPLPVRYRRVQGFKSWSCSSSRLGIQYQEQERSSIDQPGSEGTFGPAGAPPLSQFLAACQSYTTCMPFLRFSNSCLYGAVYSPQCPSTRFHLGVCASQAGSSSGMHQEAQSDEFPDSFQAAARVQALVTGLLPSVGRHVSDAQGGAGLYEDAALNLNQASG